MAKLTTNFDAVMAAAPLDRAAGAVTGKGAAYIPKAKLPKSFDAPPLRPFPHPRPRTLPDLRGLVVGRLTVIGLENNPEQTKGLRWIVRCVCGRYEPRQTRALRRADIGGAKCGWCLQTAKLQRDGSKQRTVESFLAENCESEA